MSKPLIFISHKHKDRDKAEHVAKFVRDLTAEQFDVYLSSKAGYEGPGFGQDLKKELRENLWHSALLILVFTQQDDDWSWCMWECGAADVPFSKPCDETRVVVFQCFDEAPKVFNTLSVRLQDKESVKQFAFEFLKPDFLPRHDGEAAPWKQDVLLEKAETFHKTFVDAYPQKDPPPEYWGARPFMKLRYEETEDEKFPDSLTDEPDNISSHTELLRVVDHANCLQYFGISSIDVDASLAYFAKSWQDDSPVDADARWIKSLLSEIVRAKQKKSVLNDRNAPFRHVNRDTEYELCLGRISRTRNIYDFDVHFIELGGMKKISEVMTPIDMITKRDLANQAADKISLTELIPALEIDDRTRLPVLEAGQPKYIVHLSMIDHFVRKMAFSGKPIDMLTLQHILEDNDMSIFFSNTFATVNPNATLREAWSAMNEISNCEDIFVTEDGTKEGKVVGWIVDRLLLAEGNPF